ncbi:MAG: hypothetical protein Q4D21_07935 [Phascolarctobacterium sp.]|nr:hypothetical protein [Phascolarctobacterium sp.]
MDENKATSEQNEGMSWPGFMCGLVVGAVLFYITIQIVSIFMFSRTAA